MACLSAKTLLQTKFFPGENPVSFVEAAFADLNTAIPNGAVLGYVSDLQPEFSFPAGALQLVVSRYCLAPVLVKDTPEQEFVVGKFFDPRQATKVIREHNLRLVRNYGRGVVLLKHAE